jgi:hypothetical protein
MTVVDVGEPNKKDGNWENNGDSGEYDDCYKHKVMCTRHGSVARFFEKCNKHSASIKHDKFKQLPAPREALNSMH